MTLNLMLILNLHHCNWDIMWAFRTTFTFIQLHPTHQLTVCLSHRHQHEYLIGAGDGEPADEEHDEPVDLEPRSRWPPLRPRLRPLHCQRLRSHVGGDCDDRMIDDCHDADTRGKDRRRADLSNFSSTTKFGIKCQKSQMWPHRRTCLG